ncbi:MAG: DegV family protein [Acholeplasmataceae bacterium]|jgi:DegV family protein with EDD domain|nr:DegV family protein [Acholeplasmataceae bacterium]
MSKIGLLVCGNSGIDYEKVDFPYEIVRSKLVIDGQEYEDFVDIKADEFYNIIAKNPNINLSTAQASTGEIAAKLELFKEQGYKDVIAVIISSGLSGTYQNVVLAGELVPDINLYPVDSHSVTFGQLAQVYKAAEMIKAGFPAQEIFEYLEEYKTRIQVYVLVDTLKFLVKNGRLSVASGMLGSLLKIKPLLYFTPTGHLVPYERIRTFSKARRRLIELAKQEIDDGIEGFYLAYTNNQEVVEGIRDEILAYAPELSIKLYPLTPVVGAHAGPGTCGFGIVRKKK